MPRTTPPRERPANLQLDFRLPHLMTHRVLDPKTRSEVIALLARLLLAAARAEKREVTDDAS